MPEYNGSLNLKSRKNPLGTYQEGLLKIGLRGEELSERTRSIFNKINNQDAENGNVDDFLDSTELSNFWDKLKTFAKDDTLSKKEAELLLKELGFEEELRTGEINADDLFDFIKQLHKESEDIENSDVDEDGNTTITYRTDEYGNQEVETIYTDGSTKRVTTDSEEVERTELIDADHHLTQKTTVDGDNTIIEIYTDENGNVILDQSGKEVQTKVILKQNDKDIRTITMEYERTDDGALVYDEQGNPKLKSKIVVDTSGDIPVTSTITYENGEPVRENIVRGGVITNYTYKKITDPQNPEQTSYERLVTDSVEDLGNNLKRETTYEYTDNGYIQLITEPGQNTTITKTDTTEEDDTTTSNLKQVVEYVGQGFSIESNYNLGVNPETQKVEYIISNQKWIIGDNELVAKYENGNTIGLVVQNSEMPAQIAQQFNCDLEELFSVNEGLVHGKGKNRYFRAAEVITLPGIHNVTDIFSGRESKDVVTAKYQVYMQNENMLTENGMVNHGGRGQKVRLTVNGETDIYTIKGEINGSHYIATNSSGNVVYINRSRNNLLIPENAQNIINYWNSVPEGVSEENARNIRHGNTVYRAIDWRTNSATNERDDRFILLAEESGELAIQSGDRDRNPNGTRNRFIIRDANYLTASDNYQNGIVYKNTNIHIYTTPNNQTFAFDANGNALDTEATLRNIGNDIARDLRTAADNKDAWYNQAIDFFGGNATMGTDNDLQARAIDNLRTFGGMRAGSPVNDTVSVNNVYAFACNALPYEYQHDPDGYDAVQAIYRQENSNKATQIMVGSLIANHVYSDEQAGRFVANALQYELHEGIFGITYQDNIIRVGNLLTTPEARAFAEERMSQIDPSLTKDHGSYLRAAIAGDGWTPREVNILDANSFAQSYDQKNPEDFAHMQYLVDNLVFAELTIGEVKIPDGDSIDAGLHLVGTQGTDGALYAWTIERAGEQNEERDYKILVYGQDNLQIYLGNVCMYDGTIDLEQFRKYDNTLFQKTGLPPVIQAQLGILEAKQGNADVLFDLNSDVTSEVANIIEHDESLKNIGINSYEDLYNQALKDGNPIQVKAGAIIQGVKEFSDDEIVNFCIELMHHIDDKRGRGCSSGISASNTNDAEFLQIRLQQILNLHPNLATRIKELVNNGDFSYNQILSNPEGPATIITHSTKDTYLNMINSIEYISNEAIFQDAEGNIITDEDIIERSKTQNLSAVNELREAYQQFMRNHQLDLRNEGWISGVANGLSRYSGVGTDRNDVIRAFREVEDLLNNLEAAANGQLRDCNGDVITFEKYLENIQTQVLGLQQTNNSYNSTIATGKMLIKLAPVILATIVASGGTGAAAWLVPAGVAGATTFTLNASEILTSDNKNNAQAWQDNYIETLVTAVSTGAGIKSAQSAYSLINTGNTAINTIGRMSFMGTSDALISMGGEYAMSGDVTFVGTLIGTVPGIFGNVIGIRGLGRQIIEPPTPTLSGIARNTNSDGAIIIAKPRSIQINETQANHIAHEIDALVARSNVTPQELVLARVEVETIANNEVRVAAQAKLDARAAQFSGDQLAVYNRCTQPITPTLSTAIKSVNAHGQTSIAPPRSVHVGDEKAGVITREIDNLIALSDVTPQELARARVELEGISNRNLRKSAQRRLDERALSLPEIDRLQYNVQSGRISTIPNKHTLTPEDVTIIQEFANNVTDVNLLKYYRASIQARSSIGANETAALHALDTRISALDPNYTPVTSRPAVVNTELSTPVTTEPVNLTNLPVGTELTPQQSYVVGENTVLSVGDSYNLDFSSPQLRSKLATMNDGDIITIGTAGGEHNIQVPSHLAENVSREHLQIKKVGNDFVVTNISSKNNVSILSHNPNSRLNTMTNYYRLQERLATISNAESLNIESLVTIKREIDTLTDGTAKKDLEKLLKNTLDRLDDSQKSQYEYLLHQKHFTENTSQLYTQIFNRVQDREIFYALDEQLTSILGDLSIEYKIHTLPDEVVTRINNLNIEGIENMSWTQKQAASEAAIREILNDPAVTTTLRARADFLKELDVRFKSEFNNPTGDRTFTKLFQYGEANTMNAWLDSNNAIRNVLENVVGKKINGKVITFSELDNFIHENPNIIKNAQDIVYFIGKPDELQNARIVHNILNDVSVGNIPDNLTFLTQLPEEIKGKLKNSAGTLIRNQGDLLENLSVLKNELVSSEGRIINEQLLENLSHVEGYELIQILGQSSKDGFFGNTIDLLSKIPHNNARNYGRTIWEIGKDTRLYRNVLEINHMHPELDVTTVKNVANLFDLNTYETALRLVEPGTDSRITCMLADAIHIEQSPHLTQAQKTRLVKNFLEKHNFSLVDLNSSISPSQLDGIARKLGLNPLELSTSNDRAALFARLNGEINSYINTPDLNLNADLSRAINSSNAEDLIASLNNIKTNFNSTNKVQAILNRTNLSDAEKRVLSISAAISEYDDLGIVYMELRHMGIPENEANRVVSMLEAKKYISNYNDHPNPVNAENASQHLAVIGALDDGFGRSLSELKNMPKEQKFSLVHDYITDLESITGLKLNPESRIQLEDGLKQQLDNLLRYQETPRLTDISTLNEIRNQNGVKILDGNGFEGYFHGIGLLDAADISKVAGAKSLTETLADKCTLSSSYLFNGHYDTCSSMGLILEGDLVALNPFDSQFFTRVSVDDMTQIFFNNGTNTLNGLASAHGLRQNFTNLLDDIQRQMPGISRTDAFRILQQRSSLGTDISMGLANKGIANTGLAETYNEALLYRPQSKALAYVGNPGDQIPQELLNLAKIWDLPIVLIPKK